MTSPTPKSGREDSHAKTSVSLAWVQEAVLEESSQDSSTTLLDSLQSVAPKLSSSKTLRHSSLPTMDEISRSSYGRWPTSGMASHGEYLTVDTSASPKADQESSLSDLLETQSVPARYFLSQNAATGILKKSRSNGKKSVSPFAISVGDSERGYVKKLAHCLYAESARHTGTDWSRNYVSYPEGRVRRLTPLETERLQGFPDNWTMPTHEMGNENTLDSARYHACGNAVSVPVAEWIGKRIMSVMGEKLLAQRDSSLNEMAPKSA